MTLDTEITNALDGRRLLDHPFYRRWERGEVSMDELADYAGQYRHFEAYLPEFLSELAGQLPDGTAKDLVNANLADELGDPIAHVELFGRFAEAVGASDDLATRATTALLEAYQGLLTEGPIAALAGFCAYESQASEVSRSKAAGLRLHYGMDDTAVSFWEHHAQVDEQHSNWARFALEEIAGDPEHVERAMRTGADAWWGFLDEREAASCPA
jgi:pyrroloquinoline-quinone synthase